MTTHHFKLSYKEIEKNKGKPVIDPNEINPILEKKGNSILKKMTA